MGRDVYFVASAIPYVNAEPHLGTAYGHVACDVVARYQRSKGRRVHFLTGTDEHSHNVAKSAEEQGITPQEWTDRMVPKWREVWERLQISYDDFIRTSDPRHAERVQLFVQRLHDRGEVELGSYEGPYCPSCEEFKTESELVDGTCPVHGIPVQRLKEENYFFPLSRYREPLLRLYEDRPEFILPEVRRNEIVSFVKGGLQDLSISRSGSSWGIPIPWDPGHVIYVWVDALLNYITAPGFGADSSFFDEAWPCDLHVIGKDITRFHAVIWPALLMAAGLEVPRTVFGHGFISLGGEKMSKSRGTGLHPSELLDHFGVDSYRYYFMREIQFGADGNFSWESMVERHNADLANGLGNLASRVLAMLGSYYGGQVPEPGREGAAAGLASLVPDVVARVETAMGAVALSQAVAAMWELVDVANKYLVEREPWVLAKDADRRDELGTVLYTVAETLRILAVLISPVMPSAAARLWTQLGLDGSPLQEQRLPSAAVWGGLAPGTTTAKGAALFPRLES